MELRVGAWLLTLAVALIAFTLATRSPRQDRTLPPLDIAKIAKRVEAIRGLKFKELPHVAVVSRADSRRLAREELDRNTSPSERLRREQALKIAGLLRETTSLGHQVIQEFAAGFYDDETGELVLVQAPWGNRPYYELVLAHELLHALEDQHFELSRLRDPDDDEFTHAGDALAEGSAITLEQAYERRFFDARERGLVDSAWDSVPRPRDSAYLDADADFLYQDGPEFVSRALERGCKRCPPARRWSPVNRLLRHPPRATSAILHPEVRPVSAPPVNAAAGRDPEGPGSRWRRLERLSVGEADVLATLRVVAKAPEAVATRAAQGLAGGSMELWGRGAAACPAACRHDRVLSYRLAFSAGREAREFAAAVPNWFEAERLRGESIEGLGADRVWRLPSGVVALRTVGHVVGIAFAPDRTAARRMLPA